MRSAESPSPRTRSWALPSSSSRALYMCTDEERHKDARKEASRRPDAYRLSSYKSLPIAEKAQTPNRALLYGYSTPSAVPAMQPPLEQASPHEVTTFVEVLATITACQSAPDRQAECRPGAAAADDHQVVSGSETRVRNDPSDLPSGVTAHRGAGARSGSRGRLPAPSSHTTVRTVRYTAVHEVRASLRCSSRRLSKPMRRRADVGTA